MRIWIDKGYLIQGNTLDHGGREYHASLAYQVFDADTGAPATGSYRGDAFFDGRRIVIGDPMRQANLHEYVVEPQATSESWDYYLGFKSALGDGREAIEGKYPKKMRADDPRRGYGVNSTRWWDGYRDAWREKRMSKGSKSNLVSHEVRDAAGEVIARPRSLAAAHRTTRNGRFGGGHTYVASAPSTSRNRVRSFDAIRRRAEAHQPKVPPPRPWIKVWVPQDLHPQYQGDRGRVSFLGMEPGEVEARIPDGWRVDWTRPARSGATIDGVWTTVSDYPLVETFGAYR